jgi:signal transduction histidine kinase
MQIMTTDRDESSSTLLRLQRENKRLVDELLAHTRQLPLLGAMLEGCPDALLLVDPNGVILEHNSRLNQLLETEALLHDAYVQEYFFVRSPKESAERRILITSKVLQECLIEDQSLVGYCVSGLVEVKLTAIDRLATPLIVVSVRNLDTTDLTNRKLVAARQQLQELLSRLDDARLTEEKARLNTAEVISRTFVHDLNNALMVVQGNLELIADSIADSDLNPLVISAQKATERIRDLAVSFRSLDPNRVISPKNLELTDWIRQFLKPFDRDYGIELHLDSPDDAVPVCVDDIQLSEALLDLIANALEACVEVSNLPRIAVSLSRSQTCYLTGDKFFLVKNPGNPHALIKVSDNGPGITESQMDKIFMPFVSSKPNKPGLGLANVRKILQAHGGGVYVRSRPADGAEFILAIPITSVSIGPA